MAYNYEYPYTDPHRYNSDWILTEIKRLVSEWDSISKDWNVLRDYVENFFKNLDVAEEVSEKINELVENGTIARIIEEIIKTNDYYLSVVSYGAIGDGLTDCLSAFNECIAEATDRGLNVFVPNGTYFCSNAVLIPSNMTLFGVNGKSRIVFGATPGILFTGDNSTIKDLIVESTDGLPETVNISANNCSVIDCEIIPKQVGIAINSVNNVTISGCNLHPKTEGGAAFGIWSDTEIPPRDVKITNCTMTDFLLNAIFAHMNGSIIDSCYFENNHLQEQPTGGGHLDIIGALDNNLVRTVISNNIVTGGRSVTTAFEIDANRVLITGNYVYNIQGVGVSIQNRVGVHVVGNYFQNVNTAIATANGMTDYNITGNYAELVSTFIAFGNNNERFAITDNVFNQVDKVHNLDTIPHGLIIGNAPDDMSMSWARLIQQGETVPFITLSGTDNYHIRTYFGASTSSFGITASGSLVMHQDVAQMFSDMDVENKLYLYNDNGVMKIKNNVNGSVTMYASLTKIVK